MRKVQWYEANWQSKQGKLPCTSCNWFSCQLHFGNQTAAQGSLDFIARHAAEPPYIHTWEGTRAHNWWEPRVDAGRGAAQCYFPPDSARAFPPKCSRQSGKTRQVQCQNDCDSVPMPSDLSVEFEWRNRLFLWLFYWHSENARRRCMLNGKSKLCAV